MIIAGQDKTTGIEINIAKVDLPIYNDISADPMDVSALPMITIDLVNSKTSKTAYGPREKVSLTFNASGMTDASIVVLGQVIFGSTSFKVRY